MRALASVLLLALAVPAVAQEREIRSANLPRELEWELLRMYDGAAERYDGPAVIRPAQVVRGDMAVMGGPLRIEGRVEGDVAVVNGDVIVAPGGSVTGDVMVVGGEVRLEDDADVEGTITAYATSSRRYARDRDRDDDWTDRYGDRGYSRLAVRTGASYNRVEGLPIMFGPVIETAGPNPLRLEALVIWRTEAASLDTDRMGYQVRVEQFLDERRSSVGGSLFSLIDPMDRWQLSDLEASLATVLFHDDYRDHHDREGWSVFAGVRPIEALEARVEYRDETYATAGAGDPWSLFNGGDLWRAQPVIAEGDLQVVAGSFEVDSRDHEHDPYRGWLARVEIERPVDGSLIRPSLEALQPQGMDPDPAWGGLAAMPIPTDFTTGLVDVRRYMPVSYGSQVNLRVVAGGSLSEQALPAQFQHALGGPGTLPGFPTFYGDCGARRATGSLGGERFYVGYGCDRFVLGQIEYRGSLALDIGFGDPDYHDEDDDWSWHEWDLDLDPAWVVFFDVGRGWAYDDALSGGTVSTGTLYDAGVGLLLDEGLGFYVALPLNGEVEQDPRFLIRLGRRF